MNLIAVLTVILAMGRASVHFINLVVVLANLLDLLLHACHDLMLVHHQGVLGLGDLALPLFEHLLPRGSLHLMDGQSLLSAAELSEHRLPILDLCLMNSQLGCELEVQHASSSTS